MRRLRFGHTVKRRIALDILCKISLFPLSRLHERKAKAWTKCIRAILVKYIYIYIYKQTKVNMLFSFLVAGASRSQKNSSTSVSLTLAQTHALYLSILIYTYASSTPIRMILADRTSLSSVEFLGFQATADQR